MKLASFFAGQGGFDLAAEWMGWEPVLHCEINPFCRRILNYYWTNAFSYGNIKETDFTIHRGTIDILTGGFPCQPYSVAGKRLGKEDDRHLWPEMLRGIREIQPPWVVGENVSGLVNWNGGLVFDEVQSDLEALGYEVTPFILPACGVNAPHKRYRVWFVAFNPEFSANGRNYPTKSSGNGLDLGRHELSTTGRKQGANYAEPSDKSRTIAHPKNDRRKRKPRRCRDWSEWWLLSRKIFEGSEPIGGGQIITNAHDDGSHGPENGQSPIEGNDGDATRENPVIEPSGRSGEATRKTTPNANGFRLRGQSNRERKTRFFGKDGKIGNWDNFPTEPGILRGDDGFSERMDRITVPSRKGRRTLNALQSYGRWRKETIKAHGNAIVPQVAYQIFKVIEQMNK